MKRTTAAGAVGGLYVDDNPGTATVGTDLIAEDRNNLQEEVCHPIIDAGFSLDGADDYQLERSIIAIGRGRIGSYVFEDSEIVPITIAASRSKANPTYPEYYPCIPRYDANHDVSATEVGQTVVDHFRAIKSKFKGVTDFTVTVSGSRVTFPSTGAAFAALNAIQNDALVAGFLNNEQAASFVADYTTSATKQTITVSGVEYVVSGVSPGSYYADVVGTPSAGTASIYPYRIAGSTTSFRLPRLAGFVPASAGDDDGQYSANKRVMDRFEGHVHGIRAIATSGGSTMTSERNGSAATTAIQYNTDAPLSDGTNGTPRVGKTTDPRAFGTFVGTWVRTLFATSWTSA